VKRRITILRKTPTLTPQIMTKFLFIITNKNSFCSICLLCLRLIVASEQEILSNICHRFSKMRIREFQEKDQNAAFEIWKHGMLVDLKSSWRSWILSQIHVKLMFIFLAISHLVLFDFAQSTFYEIAWTHLLWLLSSAVPCFILVRSLIWRSDYRIEGYVKNRPDMLDIQKHHGRRFLVAESEDGEIIGTAVYTTETKITHFKVLTRSQPSNLL
jgi:hypothetical protein